MSLGSRQIQLSCLTIYPGQFLHDFDVWISNVSYGSMDSKSLCGHHAGTVGGTEFINVACDNIIYGRYVTVKIPGSSEALSVCEVQVFQYYGMNSIETCIIFEKNVPPPPPLKPIYTNKSTCMTTSLYPFNY